MNIREEIQRFWAQVGGKALPLGMGGAYIGQTADAEKLKQFRAMLDESYASGLRYYDTSAKYGGSEFRLAPFLASVPRDSVFLATKSPIPSELTPQEAAVHVRQSLRNSLERLGMAHLDLFQIHDVETLDQVLAPGGALDACLQLRDEGLTRFVGIGTRSHDLLRTAAADGRFDTILTYTDFTPVSDTARDLIAFAAERGVSVINGSPLAFGLLTGSDPRANPRIFGEFQNLQQRAGQLYDFCQREGVSILAVAMQYPLANPYISLTLTGAASPEELRATMQACQTTLPPDFWTHLHQEVGIKPPV